jgi:pimeloyl-ACP methyl ester carboxylesterase
MRVQNIRDRYKIINKSVCAAALLCVLFLSGCATPVGVNVVTPREAYRNAYANPLRDGVASDQAKSVLNRYGLLEEFGDDPAATIANLHEIALHDNRRDILYALAEVSYLYGDQLAHSFWDENRKRAPDYFLLSVLYAYFFGLEERSEPGPTAFDHRFRNALDLYDFGLLQGLATGEEGGLVLELKARKLPVGQLSISLDSSRLPWKIEEFKRFEPTDRYAVRGISVHARTAGVGLPLIGVRKDTGDVFSTGQAVALTAFLRIHGDFAALSAGTASAVLELHSAQESSTIDINNHLVPLETDTTTPLAYKLEGSSLWGWGLGAFLGKEINKIPDGLYLHEPYQAGKIPVVFVHGTASSPIWWAEMFNTLSFDPLIRQKYQFWYFVYTSNKAVAMSAADLRDALKEKLASLDPQGKDPALRQMVVIGHSQGGLLAKLTAVDAGNSLLRSVTEKDLDVMQMSDESKARVRRLMIVTPLPFVKKVIFLSTPHRGSFRSKEWNRNLVRALISFPATLLENFLEYYDYLTDDVKKMMGGKKNVFTSADSMSPDNPTIQALAGIMLAPGVEGHSIIAVRGAGDPKRDNDGVVEYTSAHLSGMESELIVRSGHSSHLNPLAIDEVRRILVEHFHNSTRNRENLK